MSLFVRACLIDVPLLEDDLAHEGVLEPVKVLTSTGAPRRAVMCFFPEVVEQAGGTVHATLTSVYGGRPMYVMEHRGQSIASFYPGLGAPAAATAMEEAIAMGCRDFVAVGGAGALVPELTLGHAVVVDSAVRDEGTSFHYLPPSRSVEAAADVSAAIVSALVGASIPYLRGRSWTTDAIYRETRGRMGRRVAEGYVTVEMEAAALFAVARYRGVRVGLLVYAGDALSGETWDLRAWTTAKDVRTRMFALALDASAALASATRA